MLKSILVVVLSVCLLADCHPTLNRERSNSENHRIARSPVVPAIVPALVPVLAPVAGRVAGRVAHKGIDVAATGITNLSGMAHGAVVRGVPIAAKAAKNAVSMMTP